MILGAFLSYKYVFLSFPWSGSDLQRRQPWDRGCLGQQTQLQPEATALHSKWHREQHKAFFFPQLPLFTLKKNHISSLFQLTLRLLYSMKAEALIKAVFPVVTL